MIIEVNITINILTQITTLVFTYYNKKQDKLFWKEFSVSLEQAQLWNNFFVENIRGRVFANQTWWFDARLIRTTYFIQPKH
jgi:hypothetical protein